MSQPVQYTQYSRPTASTYYNPQISPASSSTRFSSTQTRSTVVDPYSSSDMEFKENQYMTRIDTIYQKEDRADSKKKVQKKKSKEVQDANRIKQDLYGLPQPTTEVSGFRRLTVCSCLDESILYVNVFSY
ncbi:uncharacterized protein LOC110444689 [Mizuhopecten yessoensis]|uniref:uncharacterized protein LOC110444689 n=1 Tax=Mizuhopecten yessoensis TaxID=6573 RepID=UPI000B459079|nr:uncharacterized protein LOC110444689 [Mizuhopecten yessoensis]